MFKQYEWPKKKEEKMEVDSEKTPIPKNPDFRPGGSQLQMSKLQPTCKAKKSTKCKPAVKWTIPHRSRPKRKYFKRGEVVLPAIYNKNGIHIQSGLDLCDCTYTECPGCFFPCPNCSSTKCGQECRVYRDYAYRDVVLHGFLGRKTNPYASKFNVFQ